METDFSTTALPLPNPLHNDDYGGRQFVYPFATAGSVLRMALPPWYGRGSILDAFRIPLNCPTCPKLTKIGGKGLGAEFPVFVTLPAAESYRFEIEGDTFTSLVIPEVLSGMDSFSLTFDGSEVLFPITVGEVFDLTTIDPGGLASLIIMGMDPGSDMDRYVFGAAFLSGAEETVLSMIGTGIVPEPATGIMLMLGLGMAAMLFRSGRSRGCGRAVAKLWHRCGIAVAGAS